MAPFRQMAMARDTLALPALGQLVENRILPMLREADPGDYKHVTFGYVRCSSELHQHPHRDRGTFGKSVPAETCPGPPCRRTARPTA